MSADRLMKFREAVVTEGHCGEASSWQCHSAGNQGFEKPKVVRCRSGSWGHDPGSRPIVVMDLIFASAGIDVPCSAEIGRCRSYRQQTIIEVPLAAAAAFHTTRRRLKRVL